ncbi:hypothetical protein ACIPVB_02450 [Microbacterium sp. NPDC090007]|uniref:hypothetical protein n=1 Tax=Microbacterium sp. NPDC090007 TaxID=3364204 RepID=UPI00381A74CD
MTSRTRIAAVVLLFAAATLSGCAAEDVGPIDYQAGQLSGTDPNFAEAMAECLGDAGWEVEVMADNSIQATLDGSQASAYRVAEEACKSDLNYDESPVLSEEQNKALYRGLLQLSRCLEDEGYDAGDKPSEQAFLDGEVFDPYGHLRDPARVGHIDEATYGALLTKCPRP